MNIGNGSVSFDSKYRVLDDIASTPYEDWFYIVPEGTVLTPVVKSSSGDILGDEFYTAGYTRVKFYTDRNEWDKIDENDWSDHFPTEEGTYFCKVEGKEPYTGTFEWIDLIRIEHKHTLVRTAAKAATIKSAGNIEYWTCKSCGKVFKDAAGKKEISKASTVIAKLPSVKTDLPAVTISSAKKARKAATVKWKKVSKANQKKIASIQIQYSMDKTFKKGVKTVTVKKSAASKKISKLTSKKKYYFRIRAYKKVGAVTHVSKWSKVKSAVIK